MNHWSHMSWTIQDMHQIASSSTMCNFLLHCSSYSIALNLIFTAYTFSPIFPNFLSSLAQIEPTPSRVRSHFSQKNQDAHPERARVFRNTANRGSPSNVCLPTVFHSVLYILLGMTNFDYFIIEARWRYRSADQWWWQWTPHRNHLLIRHQRW